MSEATNEIVIDESCEKRLSPPLKWAGGKRWLLDHILPLFHSAPNSRLVEPFVGGMAVALGLNPSSALLNDINHHLINFYLQIKNGLFITRELKNDEDFFYQARDRFNQLVRSKQDSSQECAELFYYLNRTAFNGLCRFNSKGEFNVPFGKYSKINYQRDFREFQSTFKNWSFTCGDFETLKVYKEDFLYVDPPYDVPFTKYASIDFYWEDQVRLVTWLTKLKSKIVVSNQATDRILDLYHSHGFTVKILEAPRRISCTGDRSSAQEIFAWKNL